MDDGTFLNYSSQCYLVVAAGLLFQFLMLMSDHNGSFQGTT